MAVAVYAAWFAALSALVVLDEVSVVMPAIYAAMSVLALALYAADKSAARSGVWRTSESPLHLVALARRAGCPARAAAQDDQAAVPSP